MRSKYFLTRVTELTFPADNRACSSVIVTSSNSNGFTWTRRGAGAGAAFGFASVVVVSPAALPSAATRKKSLRFIMAAKTYPPLTDPQEFRSAGHSATSTPKIKRPLPIAERRPVRRSNPLEVVLETVQNAVPAFEMTVATLHVRKSFVRENQQRILAAF